MNPARPRPPQSRGTRMMRDDADSLIALLGGLSAGEPGVARDARIKARCYRVLDRRRDVRPRAEASPTVFVRAALGTLTAVMCAYAVVAGMQALRLAMALL